VKSYTKIRTDYGTHTKNTSSANLTWGDSMMNDYHRRLLTKVDWPFLKRTRTLTTVASTDFLNLPYDTDQVESVTVTVGSTLHQPKPSPSRKHWDDLHYTSYTSDIPEYWFIYNGQLGLWPTPATSGNTITLNVKIRAVDLSVADYTTGTITTATNGDETIVASATTFTYPMVGRWLRITQDDGTDSGDGLWYEISAITNTTNLELVRKYGGTSIVAGSQAYTIGMMPLLPEAFHDLPEQHASFMYWAKEKDSTRASAFKTLRDESITDLQTAYSINDLSMVIDDGEDGVIVNPNLIVNL
jgi:hypothetical protein